MIPQLRPGLPGYTGPKSGIFAVIHHRILFEYSHDVFERLDCIDRKKPEHGRKIRRESILYLGECPALAEFEKAQAERNKMWAEYNEAVAEYEKAVAERNKMWAEYKKARAEFEKAQAEYDEAADENDKARVEYEKAWAEYAKAAAEFDKALSSDAEVAAEFEKAQAEYDEAADAVDQSAVLAYIRQHITEFPWDGRQLVFPKAAV